MFLQFHKMANIYFLILCSMDSTALLSVNGQAGFSVLMVPLTIVVGMSMIKDAFEDYQRRRSDYEENNRTADALPLESQDISSGDYRERAKSSVGPEDRVEMQMSTSMREKHFMLKENLPKNVSMFKSFKWSKIQVGQIIRVNQNEYFPCDMLLLKSALPKGVCYVETKNLDGETNMKHKKASKDVLEHADDIINGWLQASVTCEKENESIYTYQGMLNVDGETDGIILDAD
jgi:hypothetical protein